MENYDIDPVFGCHIWLGTKTKDGYGVHKSKTTHRQAWIDANGAVPAGRFLDHTCRRRSCMNPDHLEAVTQSVNELRKRWSYRVQIKACQNGHSRKKYGLITPEGGFVCRIC
jgi:hypothetical protein